MRDLRHIVFHVRPWVYPQAMPLETPSNDHKPRKPQTRDDLPVRARFVFPDRAEWIECVADGWCPETHLVRVRRPWHHMMLESWLPRVDIEVTGEPRPTRRRRRGDVPFFQRKDL